jgi:hypothetical protein
VTPLHRYAFLRGLIVETNSVSAKHMSQIFPGSGLLQQESEGVRSLLTLARLCPVANFAQHTTLAAPSICVAKSIRHYFQTGTLPAVGTLCQADLKPLVGTPNQAMAVSQALSPADRKLFGALMAEVQQGPISPF